MHALAARKQLSFEGRTKNQVERYLRHTRMTRLLQIWAFPLRKCCQQPQSCLWQEISSYTSESLPLPAGGPPGRAPASGGARGEAPGEPPSLIAHFIVPLCPSCTPSCSAKMMSPSVHRQRFGGIRSVRQQASYTGKAASRRWALPRDRFLRSSHACCLPALPLATHLAA